jgi:Kef-type K+ transport system membrane component KefB
VAAFIFLSVVGYALGLLVFVRPLLCKVIDLVESSGSRALQATLLAFTFLFVFFSAWVTEILGVHAIFG